MDSIRRRRFGLGLAGLAAVSVMTVTGVLAAASRSTPDAPPTEPHAIESFLKHANQALMDAVARGDTSVWSRYLSADCLYTDEEGNTNTKAQLLAQLRPLPSGYHGTIRLLHPRVVIRRETAVLTTELLEKLALYGQLLETRFHMTSTWVREPDGWKMIASQTSVLPSEHKTVKLDPAAFDAYVGTYGLAPNVIYTVTQDGKKLYGQRQGRAREELLPLGADRFFRRGLVRGEKIFVRNAKGKVTQMIDRRDNNDLIWRRIK